MPLRVPLRVCVPLCVCLCVFVLLLARSAALPPPRQRPNEECGISPRTRIRTAVTDIIVAFEPNTRTEGPLFRARVAAWPFLLLWWWWWLCDCVFVCCAGWRARSAELHDDSGLRRTTRLTPFCDDLYTFCFLTDSPLPPRAPCPGCRRASVLLCFCASDADDARMIQYLDELVLRRVPLARGCRITS